MATRPRKYLRLIHQEASRDAARALIPSSHQDTFERISPPATGGEPATTTTYHHGNSGHQTQLTSHATLRGCATCSQSPHATVAWRSAPKRKPPSTAYARLRAPARAAPLPAGVRTGRMASAGYHAHCSVPYALGRQAPFFTRTFVALA
jgi:hypothetical protein